MSDVGSNDRHHRRRGRCRHCRGHCIGHDDPSPSRRCASRRGTQHPQRGRLAPPRSPADRRSGRGPRLQTPGASRSRPNNSGSTPRPGSRMPTNSQLTPTRSTRTASTRTDRRRARRPSGLRDADHVARGVAERAVARAPRLGHGLLKHLGARRADLLERGVEVVGAEDRGLERSLRDEREEGVAFGLRTAAVGLGQDDVDVLPRRADGDPAEAAGRRRRCGPRGRARRGRSRARRRGRGRG